MELWLLAIIAVALIPVVRLFMADSCPRATEPPPAPGSESLIVDVTSTGALPDIGGRWTTPAVVEILRGEVVVTSPSGVTRRVEVPRGGIIPPGREFAVTPDMFVGEDPPYGWSATCRISLQCTSGPSALGCGSGSSEQSRETSIEWDWDANVRWNTHFLLRIAYESLVGGGAGSLRWELVGYPP